MPECQRGGTNFGSDRLLEAHNPKMHRQTVQDPGGSATHLAGPSCGLSFISQAELVEPGQNAHGA
jgi:hypothetical protein